MWRYNLEDHIHGNTIIPDNSNSLQSQTTKTQTISKQDLNNATPKVLGHKHLLINQMFES
jgi:hypothetical protein